MKIIAYERINKVEVVIYYANEWAEFKIKNGGYIFKIGKIIDNDKIGKTIVKKINNFFEPEFNIDDPELHLKFIRIVRD